MLAYLLKSSAFFLSTGFRDQQLLGADFNLLRQEQLHRDGQSDSPAATAA